MLPRPEILLLILGCLAVTILPRVFPLLMIDKVSPGPRALTWLRYVVPAVIVSLLFQDVLTGAEGMLNPLPIAKIIATVAALFIAFVSRSIIWTVVGSIGCYAFLKILLP